MRGLKTQESEKFNKFFVIVQKAAQNKNAVFFLEAGDGRDFETSEMEGEDLQGWLIPNNQADEFEPIWRKNEVSEKWEVFFCFAVWRKRGERFEISFE